MKYNIQKFILAFFLFVGIPSLKAQSGFVSSGEEITGANGSVSNSVGQVNYITASGSGGTAQQGLNQPYQILIITGIEETGISLTCSVYPNPSTDFILLKMDNLKSSNLSYQLFDLHGKLLSHKNIESNEEVISMTGFINGVYIVSVKNNSKEVKSFKIIK